MSLQQSVRPPVRALFRLSKHAARPLSSSSSFSAQSPDEQPPSTDKPAVTPSRKLKATESPLRELRHATKNLAPENGIQAHIERALLDLAKERGVEIPNDLQTVDPNTVRLPRSIQALHLAPLKRTPTHGIPVCNMQLRSFSARNLEFMADFALRAAYFLDLPAKGPVPLPRITQRWTVPRSLFVHKKSQENWERVTMRRLIQIQDGHPEVVQRWLAFVRKWMWYGVGVKADVWEYEGVDVVKNMDANSAAVAEGIENVDWSLLGRKKGLASDKEVVGLLDQHGFAESVSSKP